MHLNFFNFFAFLKILKYERNVTNFGYVIVSRFHITHKNFPEQLHGCSIIFFFFYKSSVLDNVKKIEKIHMDSEKSINSFEMTIYLITY